MTWANAQIPLPVITYLGVTNEDIILIKWANLVDNTKVYLTHLLCSPTHFGFPTWIRLSRKMDKKSSILHINEYYRGGSKTDYSIEYNIRIYLDFTWGYVCSCIFSKRQCVCFRIISNSTWNYFAASADYLDMTAVTNMFLHISSLTHAMEKFNDNIYMIQWWWWMNCLLVAQCLCAIFSVESPSRIIHVQDVAIQETTANSAQLPPPQRSLIVAVSDIHRCWYSWCIFMCFCVCHYLEWAM